MKLRKTRLNRRLGVVLTISSLIIFMMLFEYGKFANWTAYSIILEVFLVVVFIVSFIYTFIKTGLWSFIHQPLWKFDEREMELTGRSLRYAYSVFSVLVLLVLMYFSLTETSISMLLVAVFIFFAHLLPASIIAWMEKDI